MSPSLRLALVAAAGLAGCTPLGAWVYDAPRFTVAEIRPAPDGRGGSALEVVLTGCNVNDYELTADSLLARFLVGGKPVSASTYNAPFALPMRDSAQIVLGLDLDDEQLRGLRGGGDREVGFTLHTVGTVRTPMGARLVETWNRGKLRLKAYQPVSWAASVVEGCRPGTSVLPPAAGRTGGAPLPSVRPPEQMPQVPSSGAPR